MLRVVTSDWAMAADEAIVRIRARRHGLMAIPFVTSTAQTRSICPVFHAAKRLPETEEELQETEQTYREWIQVSVGVRAARAGSVLHGQCLRHMHHDQA
jgi:hypothetical protein